MPHDARCPKRNCGGTIEARIVEFGHVVYACASCERKARRICQDCGERTPSARCWRCRICAARNRLVLARPRDRARYARRRPYVLKQHKKYRTDPVIRAHRQRYMAEYRERNPRDHHDRAYGREYMRQRRADPAYCAREQRRKRARRRERRIERQEAA